MIEIRFKDIDPDSGWIVQDKLVCQCPDDRSAKFVLYSIKNFETINDGNPNREYYIEGSKESFGSHEERVAWLFKNYYETGLEYESLCRNLKNTDLDSLRIHDGVVSVPKLCKDLVI
jgi:hypothetical protein